MNLLFTSSDLNHYRHNTKNLIVGFVPTMGALHDGHLSLVKQAKKESDIVIVSIFVNPTQFNDPQDLKNYPRTLDEDLAILASVKTDAVFIPAIEDIYPEKDTRIFEFGNLGNIMEGRYRPGHFNGVAQVVSKLFDLVKPHKAFFGQKDFQQFLIIKKLVEIQNYNIEIIPCPIIRETDGLAMSSRNRLLTPEQRAHASFIYKTLIAALIKKKQFTVSELKTWVTATINNDPFMDVEYFEIVNSNYLIPVDSWEGPEPKIACVAVKIGSIRLIDNIFFD